MSTSKGSTVSSSTVSGSPMSVDEMIDAIRSSSLPPEAREAVIEKIQAAEELRRAADITAFLLFPGFCGRGRLLKALGGYDRAGERKSEVG